VFDGYLSGEEDKGVELIRQLPRTSNVGTCFMSLLRIGLLLFSSLVCGFPG